MPTNDPRPTKAQRRDDARAKALQLKQEQAKREKRNRIIAISGLVAALAVLAVVITIIMSQQSDSSTASEAAYTGDPVTLSEVKEPSTAQPSNGGIPVASEGVAGTTADGGTVVDVYLDYMCPVCGTFEAANAHQLEELRASGDVTVVYHPISILDRASNGTAFSTRAANAAAAVADLAPDKFLAFNDAMFANQPEEGTSGLSDEQIAEIAREAGVPDDVIAEFTKTDGDNPWRVYAPYVSALTQQAGDDLEAAGTNLATPTIVIDGKPLDTSVYDWRIDGKLIEAVEAAKS